MAYRTIDLNHPPSRVNARVSEDTARDIAAHAQEEKRTWSRMAILLIEEALQARALNDPTPF